MSRFGFEFDVRLVAISYNNDRPNYRVIIKFFKKEKNSDLVCFLYEESIFYAVL